jgi:hypothetical protein
MLHKEMKSGVRMPKKMVSIPNVFTHKKHQIKTPLTKQPGWVGG